jgi:hypothetical protein
MVNTIKHSLFSRNISDFYTNGAAVYQIHGNLAIEFPRVKISNQKGILSKNAEDRGELTVSNLDSFLTADANFWQAVDLNTEHISLYGRFYEVINVVPIVCQLLFIQCLTTRLHATAKCIAIIDADSSYSLYFPFTQSFSRAVFPFVYISHIFEISHII